MEIIEKPDITTKAIGDGNMNTHGNVIPFEDSKAQGVVVDSPKCGAKIKLGKEKPQAPEGNYTALCVHVEPNWTFLGNRKVAVYFEIDSGPYAGTTARLFYPLKRWPDNTYEIVPKSKLMRDIVKLFPNEAEKREIDPVALFSNKFFDIEVIQIKSKNGEVNSIVNTLTHFDPNF